MADCRGIPAKKIRYLVFDRILIERINQKVVTISREQKTSDGIIISKIKRFIAIDFLSISYDFLRIFSDDN